MLNEKALINLINIPLTGRDLSQARQLHYGAALETLTRLQLKPSARYPKVMALMKELQTEIAQTGLVEAESLLGKIAVGELATIQAVFSHSLFKQLVKKIADATNTKAKVVKKGMIVQLVTLINEGKQWQKFTRTFHIGDEIFHSTFTPINAAFDPTFASYGQTGYSSLTTKLSEHELPLEQRGRATNGWLTQFSRNNELLFTAFRSGVASEKHVADSQKRQTLAWSKMYDLLKAMGVEYLKNQPRAEQQAIFEGGKIANIPIVSTSLLTSMGKLGWLPGLRLDKTILKEHAAALSSFHEQKTQFAVVMEGQTKNVSVTFTIINFNKAVNEFRYWGANLLGQQKVINKVAFQRLKKLTVEKLAQLENEAETNWQLRIRIEKIKQLWARIEAVSARRNWRSFSGSGMGYELPALVSNLGYQLGAMVHYNCMSGKDRTGMADVEAKLLAYQMDFRARAEIPLLLPIELVPNYKKKLSDDDAEAAIKLIFESGNLDIQQINTGVAGYKIRGAMGGRWQKILATQRSQQILRQYLAWDDGLIQPKQFNNLVNAFSIFTEA